MNGSLKSLLQFHAVLLLDAAMQCSTTTSLDSRTVERRVKHEGMAFLTITLPFFGEAFDRSLSLGMIDSDLFSSFRMKRGGSLPIFLSGLTSQVFDLTSGVVHAEPSYTAILFIRTVCRFFKKLETPCTEKRINASLTRYIQCDDQLRGSDRRIQRVRSDHLGRTCRLLWGLIPESLSGSMSLLPRHGPGATAQRVVGNKKYQHLDWHERLQNLFPLDHMLFFNATHWIEKHQDVRVHSPRNEPPVRVITVPKTATSPRIIAIEPVAMQYAQQSVLRELVPWIEDSSFVKGHLNFSDQGINQKLALSSSSSCSLATLDLSEASDRVSCRLIWDMLESVPDFRNLVFACRSTRADIPSHGVKHLRKFASMGSALCFPMESMLFISIILSERIRSTGTRITPSSIRGALEGVYVYGDDIIVPIDVVDLVIDGLESFGLKINTAKSHWTGQFRESCGIDAYNGVVVTPPYCRHLPPLTRLDATKVVSYVSLANQLYAAGMWKTSFAIRKYIERVIKHRLPYNDENFGGLAWHTFLDQKDSSGWSEDYQVPTVRCLTVSDTSVVDELDGYPAMLKWIINRSETGRKVDFRRRVLPGTIKLVPGLLPIY